MWFKNLTLFRIVQWPKLGAEDLQARLGEHAIRPCGNHEPMTLGWSSPYGIEDERMVHSVGSCHLLRFTVRERVLPPAVVKEKVAERSAAFEAKTGKRPGRRQQVTLRDEVMMELLPQAFVKPAYTDCYVDVDGGWFVVNTASAKRAEEISTALRHALEGVKLQAIDASNKIKTMLTHWLEHAEAGGDFALGEDYGCHHLDVKVAHLKRAVSCLADKSKCFWQDRVE